MADNEDCLNTCHSVQHGNELTAIVACPEFSDNEVISFLAWRCRNYVAAVDQVGRSLVHVAASAGYLDLLRHLLQKRVCLNEQDEESGYTPLHCSLLYGQVHCAVRLLQLGATASILDYDFLSPIALSNRDIVFSLGGLQNSRKVQVFTLYNDCEPYVWGTNANYTLGFGHNKEKSLPEVQDFFRRHDRTVIQICMQKFHTVFVCADGSVWSCGHGAGGRLGHGTEVPALEPKRVVLPESMKCVVASVADDHTIFLTDIGLAWTCGLNTHKQLGHSPPPASLPSPKPIRNLTKLRGVYAAMYHSVFWNKTQIFTCGLNAGQLGHTLSDGAFIVNPKEVACIKIKGIIKSVSSSPAAIAVLDEEGAVYLISNYKCTRITPRGWLRVSEKVFIEGGSLDSKVSNCCGDFGELKVALLTAKSVYVWRNSTSTFMLCLFSVRRELLVSDIAFFGGGCIFSTFDGEAYLGYFRDGKKNKSVEVVDLRLLAHIHRAAGVSADPKGRNFAVLQSSPKFFLDFTPSFEDVPSLATDLSAFLDEAKEDDGIHDIVFKVGGRRYPAHKFIVFYANKYTSMRKVLEDLKEEEDEIDLNDLPCEGFEKVLLYIYTMNWNVVGPIRNTYVSDEDSEKISAYESYKNKIKAPREITELRFVARRLGVFGLLKCLDGIDDVRFGLNRKAFKCDVTLKSTDGTFINAHKCVLVARLDYFRVMLTHGWREAKELELKIPLPGRILEVLIEFLYNDDCREIATCSDLDFLSLVLVAADEFFCDGLKRLTEVSLVNQLTLRNAVDLLQLATTYNAPHLLKCAQLFICQNLTAFLESRALEVLSDATLKTLSALYRSKLSPSRRLRSSLDEIGIATVKSVAESYPVTIELEAEIAKPVVKTPSSKKKEKKERRTSERMRLISVDSCDESAIITTSPATATSPANVEKIKLVNSPIEPVTECRELSKTSQQVQTRLKAINASINSPEPSVNFTQLTLKTNEISLDENFPELNKQGQDKYPSGNTPRFSPSDYNKKFTKLSQKERKRLASVSTTTEELSEPTPVRSAWAVIPPLQPSIDSHSSGPTHLAEIIVSEREEREKAARMKSKPLYFTQLEDRAIHDLTLFYNADGMTEERITVRRLVSTLPAPPVWVHNTLRQH